MIPPDTPAKLFKYCGPDRLDALTKRLLRYSPLGAFNDPFEGRPEVTALSSDDEARQMIEELLPGEVERLHKTLPEEAQKALPPDALLVLFRAFAAGKEGDMLAQWKALAALVAPAITRAMDRQIGALCLSEVPDSLLMWAHYAASHAGFVLQFNARHAHFHEQRTEVDEFRRLRRVQYRETRPSAPLTGLDGVDVFLVKSGHWTHEREWRILRALSEADSIIDAQPFPIHLFRYPAAALTGVIVGARATDSTLASVRTALSASPDFAHVQLRRAVPDPTHFLLRVVDLA